MDKNSTRYTFLFALAVCVACSFFLALVSEGLRARRELNEKMDIEKNILKAVELKTPLDPHASIRQVRQTYQQKIKGLVVDAQGTVVEGKLPEQIKEGEDLYPLYIYQEDGQTLAYCFPVYGKGLWSIIYGYLAVESDAVTVRGITFYKHGETPGLGGEVSAKWFQKQFHGKKIYDTAEQQVRPVQVIKGKVSSQVKGRVASFAVDGISGATMTSKGVTRFLDQWIRIYEGYLKKVR